VEVLKKSMSTFTPRFILNQVRDNPDISIGHQLVAACARHLGVRATYAGFLHYDDSVWQAVRRRKLFMVDAPTSRVAEEVRQLARGLLQGESLSLPWA
jgi:flagellar biosynthesis protein FlhG